MKKYFALATAICVLLIMVFPEFCLAKDGKTQFEQVGYFKTKKMRGFTFYVKNPTKGSIKSFCQKMNKEYQEGRYVKN